MIDVQGCNKSINDSSIKNIFELRFQIRKAFFADFESGYDFPNEIKLSHIKALMFIRMEGCSQMSCISEMSNLEKGSFTTVANRLIKLGYIEKAQDEFDKRAFNLKLTAKGYALTEEIATAHCAYISAKLDQLKPEEQELFHSSLNTVIALSKKCD